MEKMSFTSNSVILYERTKILVLKYEDIVCFATDRPYLVITTIKKQQLYIQISLSKIVSTLPEYFCLCSQSVIINLSYVCLYEERDNHCIVYLLTSDSFEVSRRCRKEMKSKIVYLNKIDTYDKQRTRSVTISNE